MADYSRERHGRSEYAEDSETRIDLKAGRIMERDFPDKTVGRQVEYIQEQLQRQDAVIRELEERLSVILSPELDGDKQPGESDTSPLRTQSELAEQLESYGDRLARQTYRLTRIHDRINL